MPEPPAPTMTTSNLRVGRSSGHFTVSTALGWPSLRSHEPDDGEYMQSQADASELM